MREKLPQKGAVSAKERARGAAPAALRRQGGLRREAAEADQRSAGLRPAPGFLQEPAEDGQNRVAQGGNRPEKQKNTARRGQHSME